MTRRSIIVEIWRGENRALAEARAMLDYAAHRPTVLCGLDEPSWTWTQIWVQACTSDYSLNWTARSSAMQGWKRCLWCSSPSHWWPSRSGGGLSASGLPWSIDYPARIPDSLLKSLCAKSGYWAGLRPQSERVENPVVQLRSSWD